MSDRLPFAMTTDSGTYFLAYDQVGSLRVVADGSGNAVKRIDYDSFGNVFNDSDPDFAVPFGFAGGLHDRDTGLVRFGFRDYDPDTGRWTAKDPIGFAGGDSDLYGYCLGDPVNRFDPSGLIDAYTMEGVGWAIAVAEPSPVGEIVMALYTGAKYGMLAAEMADNMPEPTPHTDPDDFERIKGCKAKKNKKTGEIWEPDPSKHGGEHYEVFKNVKKWEKGIRDRAVWLNGKLKAKF